MVGFSPSAKRYRARERILSQRHGGTGDERELDGFINSSDCPLLPRRWVVERTFGWLNKFRLLSKEYEATLESSKADIEIAMIHIMMRKLA